MHEGLDDWIAREAIPFSLDSPEAFDAAVDRMMAALGDSVELLGLGEAFHGGEAILQCRNRLFQRLVEAHGFSAIALEASLPHARVVDEYVAGRGAAAFEAIRDTGISHGFGRLAANRELVEWLRQYNADPARAVTVCFYGFDQPALTASPASPATVLGPVLDYLTECDAAAGHAHRALIAPLLGEASRWTDPMAWRDPAISAESVAAATALRLETEDLISVLHVRRPELIARTGVERYQMARHDAAVARQFLRFFVVLAQAPDWASGLAVRDALMADNLTCIVGRERGRGRVFAFAHNVHLQRGQARLQMGPELSVWWPAGSHLAATLGRRYVVLGSAVGVSEANGIGQPEAGTPEARLAAEAGPMNLIPTRGGEGLPAPEIAALSARSVSASNPGYQPLSPTSLTDFDWLVFLSEERGVRRE